MSIPEAKFKSREVIAHAPGISIELVTMLGGDYQLGFTFPQQKDIILLLDAKGIAALASALHVLRARGFDLGHNMQAKKGEA